MAEVDDRFAAMGVDDNRPVGPIVVELQCLGRLLVSCLRNITLKAPQPDTSHGVEIQRTGITHVDAFAAVDPAKIINKVKIHLLAHIGTDIRRFGPIICSSTEGFECFNAVFRLCSVFSNGQAPS